MLLTLGASIQYTIGSFSNVFPYKFTQEDVSSLSDGEWNCVLQSKAIADNHEGYWADQEFFNLKTVTPAEIQGKEDFPQEIELTDGESYRYALMASFRVVHILD